MAVTDQMVALMRALGQDCEDLRFEPPAAYVYNPLVYAWEPYAEYLRRYVKPGVEAILVGMNPGPFGMLQTGVPFGDIGMVRDWLGIEGQVEQPPQQHPKRIIHGYGIGRGEVSGRRVWGWARERFATPQDFAAKFFVTNYCPLGFFDAKGANVTPDALRGAPRDALYEVCDRAMRETLQLLRPKVVIGIGRFAEKRLQQIAEPLGIAAGGVTHPSPANPRSHGGWTPHMDAAAAECGITLPA